MATSTTLKLPEELKERIKPLAKAAGKTPHAWMVEALQLSAALAEKRSAFIAAALQADEEVEKSGEAYAAEAVHRYIAARAAGRKGKRPKAVKW